jgi:hypothetical protein
LPVDTMPIFGDLPPDSTIWFNLLARAKATAA